MGNEEFIGETSDVLKYQHRKIRKMRKAFSKIEEVFNEKDEDENCDFALFQTLRLAKIYKILQGVMDA